MKKRNDPPDKCTLEEEKGYTMDYEQARHCSVWKIERELADDIMEKYSPYWTDHDAILVTLKRK